MPARPLRHIPTCIVSGGQTGVDRGALEAAIALGIAHGGWCPRGRLSEDGSIPSRYELSEHDSSDYASRTEQNVIDSDATLIFYRGVLKGGTLLTRQMARKHAKPHLLVRLDRPLDVDEIRGWLDEYHPEKLNVAGPRGSSNPGIEEATCKALIQVLSS